MQTDMDFQEFVDTYYNELVEEIDAGMRGNLTITENLRSDIRQITIDSGETAIINHSLKKTPKYRIILRQSGNGLISDGDIWTDKKISLVNNGPDEVKLTVGIFKE